MREIRLSNADGVVALVDDEDFDLLSKFKWRWHVSGRTAYARTWTRVDGVDTQPYMHVMIMGFSPIDHISGDGLDNRRANLRAAGSRNSQNSRKPLLYKGRQCSSQFKGVGFKPGNARRPWRAYIVANRQWFYLGVFASEVEAAKAYDQAALLHFGEFAKLNFPEKE